MTYKNNTICLIFSKDRPMQLSATLDTIKHRMKDLNFVDVCILYKCSTKRYEVAYRKLKQKYDCKFINEKKNGFYLTCLQLLNSICYDYILFFTDDTILFDNVYIQDITRTLNKHPTAIGFSLRLGENTNFCYMKDQPQKIGNSKRIINDIHKDKIIYEWTNSTHDFGYPLELSSSLYRRCFAFHLIRNLDFKDPNTMEFKMDAHKHLFSSLSPHLISFKTSKAVSIPANLTQQSYHNKHVGKKEFSINNLLKLFEKNRKIDISIFEKIRPNSVHVEIPYVFITEGAMY